MSVSRPEGRSEYSRGSGRETGGDGADRGAGSGRPAGSAGADRVAAGGSLVGALALLAAELAPLFTVHSSVHDRLVASVTAGSHHDWALLPIAVLAAWWSVVRRRWGRPGPIVIGVLGAVALAIALAHDLPDARATGLIGHAGGSYAAAAASPALGFYLETFGAVVLMLSAAACALLRPSRPSRPRGPRGTKRPRGAASRPRRSAS